MNDWDKAYLNLSASNPVEDAHDDTASNWFWGIVAAALTLVWCGWLLVWVLEMSK